MEKYIQRDYSEYEALRVQYANTADPQIKEQIRALGELVNLKNDLDLTNGDPNTKQLGGRYGDVKGKIAGYHAHHIPPKSVSDHNMNTLPAICMTSEDHRMTASYGNRMKAVFSPEDKNDNTTYKEKLIKQINDGNYADAFRNEVYEIKMKFGDKYDGAIKQAIEANADYLKEFGNPHKNQGIEAFREKSADKTSNQTANKGIESFRSKEGSQMPQRNQHSQNAQNGNQSSGQASGSGQGR
ncbi:MAG: hypothetical protein FWG90_08415 [Oscillospiraceae bacterium]|nr:hypothetical protein [Oscillospiraceae bacterium]